MGYGFNDDDDEMMINPWLHVIINECYLKLFQLMNYILNCCDTWHSLSSCCVSHACRKNYEVWGQVFLLDVRHAILDLLLDLVWDSTFGFEFTPSSFSLRFDFWIWIDSLHMSYLVLELSGMWMAPLLHYDLALCSS